MGRAQDTRHIASPLTAEAWHIAGDGRGVSDREKESPNPLGKLCSLASLKTRIQVAKAHELEPSQSEHGISLEARFWRRSGRGD